MSIIFYRPFKNLYVGHKEIKKCGIGGRFYRKIEVSKLLQHTHMAQNKIKSLN